LVQRWTDQGNSPYIQISEPEKKEIPSAKGIFVPVTFAGERPMRFNVSGNAWKGKITFECPPQLGAVSLRDVQINMHTIGETDLGWRCFDQRFKTMSASREETYEHMTKNGRVFETTFAKIKFPSEYGNGQKNNSLGMGKTYRPDKPHSNHDDMQQDMPFRFLVHVQVFGGGVRAVSYYRVSKEFYIFTTPQHYARQTVRYLGQDDQLVRVEEIDEIRNPNNNDGSGGAAIVAGVVENDDNSEFESNVEMMISNPTKLLLKSDLVRVSERLVIDSSLHVQATLPRKFQQAISCFFVTESSLLRIPPSQIKNKVQPTQDKFSSTVQSNALLEALGKEVKFTILFKYWTYNYSEVVELLIPVNLSAQIWKIRELVANRISLFINQNPSVSGELMQDLQFLLPWTDLHGDEPEAVLDNVPCNNLLAIEKILQQKFMENIDRDWNLGAEFSNVVVVDEFIDMREQNFKFKIPTHCLERGGSSAIVKLNTCFGAFYDNADNGVEANFQLQDEMIEGSIPWREVVQKQLSEESYDFELKLSYTSTKNGTNLLQHFSFPITFKGYVNMQGEKFLFAH